jgi:hypothetical protein
MANILWRFENLVDLIVAALFLVVVLLFKTCTREYTSARLQLRLRPALGREPPAEFEGHLATHKSKDAASEP